MGNHLIVGVRLKIPRGFHPVSVRFRPPAPTKQLLKWSAVYVENLPAYLQTTPQDHRLRYHFVAVEIDTVICYCYLGIS